MSTPQTRDDRGFFALALGTPLGSLWGLSMPTKLSAVIGGVVTALVSLKLFFALALVLLLTQWLDFWLAVHRVRKAGEAYDDQRARDGRVAKIGSLLLVVILRAMEALLPLAVPALNTHGALACAALIALWREEAESAEEHIKALGGHGIPILSQILAVFRRAEQLLMPRLPAPPDTASPIPSPAPKE